MLINVNAMLIVLVALVHLANAVIGFLPLVDCEVLSLQRILGWIMVPFVWLAGVPCQAAVAAVGLMGIKMVLNVLLPYNVLLLYIGLAKMVAGDFVPRTRLIMSYALFGFANFSVFGMMIGGLATIVPERRAEIAGLGMRSILAGTLATLSTVAVAGIVY